MTLDDVADMALALPGVAEGTSYGNRAWKVGTKMFAWERPFSKADVRRFGDEPVPEGEIVGFRCADLDDKAAVLQSGVAGVFTIEHFDGYAAVLAQLDVIATDDLHELMVDAWMTAAPATLRLEHFPD